MNQVLSKMPLAENNLDFIITLFTALITTEVQNTVHMTLFVL